MGKNHEECLSHVNACRVVTLAMKYFIIKLYEDLFYGYCLDFSLAITLIVHLANEQNGLGGRMEIRHRISSLDFYSPWPTWLKTLLSAESVSSRDQRSVPNMALIPEVIELLSGVWIIELDYFHHGITVSSY